MTARRPDRADIEAALAQIPPLSDYDRKIQAHLEAVLSREAAGADALLKAQQQLIAGLPASVTSIAELAAAIRGGEVAASPAMIKALREQVLAQLAIDNPAYSSYRKYR